MSKLRDLLAATPEEIRARAQRLRSFWRVKGELRNDPERGEYTLYILRTKPPRSNKTQQIFTQWIRVYGQTGPGASSTLSQRVWCRCSCEYFMYHLEVALASVGSTDVKYSNGMLPTMTNPGMVRYFCKHLYRTGVQVAKIEQRRHKDRERKRKARDEERRATVPSPSEMLLSLRE